MVRGGMFSVILSVTWGLGPKCPRFREACCLLVFGLSSGATQVTPATTYHKPERNTKNHAVPLAALFARRNGPRAEGAAGRSGRRGEATQESRMVLAQGARRDAAGGEVRLLKSQEWSSLREHGGTLCGEESNQITLLVVVARISGGHHWSASVLPGGTASVPSH